MPRLIGITGFKTSGKDSTYQFIKDLANEEITEPEFPIVVQRAAFADSLKIAAATAIGYEESRGFDRIALMDECKETWKFTIGWNDADEEQFASFSGRQYLQWFGGGMRDVFGENFWIDQVLPYPGFVMGNMAEEAEARYQEESFWRTRYPDADVVVVTDVRYPNEAKRIKELDGEIWEIVRPGLKSDGHSSETPLPRELVDKVIQNDGTLEDLKRKVAKTMRKVAKI